MKSKPFCGRLLGLLALVVFGASTLAVIARGTTAFTDQGQLREGSTNANGNYSLTFKQDTDEKHIVTVDADGVALAAIQGLHEVVREKEIEIAKLRKRLEGLEKAVAALVPKPNGGDL